MTGEEGCVICVKEGDSVVCVSDSAKPLCFTLKAVPQGTQKRIVSIGKTLLIIVKIMKEVYMYQYEHQLSMILRQNSETKGKFPVFHIVFFFLLNITKDQEQYTLCLTVNTSCAVPEN